MPATWVVKRPVQFDVWSEPSRAIPAAEKVMLVPVAVGWRMNGESATGELMGSAGLKVFGAMVLAEPGPRPVRSKWRVAVSPTKVMKSIRGNAADRFISVMLPDVPGSSGPPPV